MSELLSISECSDGFRSQLLVTVSAVALIGFVYAASEAKAADDADRPTVWIELGGQFERVDGGQEPFAPPFIVATPRPSVETVSPLSSEHAPRFSLGGESKITFEPDGSDWVFSASVRFGRANGDKHVRQQSQPGPVYHTSVSGYVSKVFPAADKFVDTKAQGSESDTIIDFQAGKDVGLGIFGRKGTSVVSAGVRFAQFGLKSNVALGSDPDWHFAYRPNGAPKYEQPFHSNAAHLAAARSFHGIGPALTWNAFTPFEGNADRGEIALDWGLNAAILFGRQKTVVHHQTTGRYHPDNRYTPVLQLVYQTSAAHTRSRTVTVPDVGGFAGLSFLYSDAKISFGYRADLFFGAMDGGIDTAKSENRGFYGPFTTISIGIGG